MAIFLSFVSGNVLEAFPFMNFTSFSFVGINVNLKVDLYDWNSINKKLGVYVSPMVVV